MVFVSRELRNLRHEYFCREIILNGGNGTEAWRSVNERFPHSQRATHPKTYGVVAARLNKYPYIRKRIAELRAEMARKADITLEKVLTDYQLALDMAKSQGKPGEIVTAATAQAKLVGLLRDRIETGAVGDFDSMDVGQILETVASEAGQEAANALAKIFGIDPVAAQPKTSGKPSNGEIELLQSDPPSDAMN